MGCKSDSSVIREHFGLLYHTGVFTQLGHVTFLSLALLLWSHIPTNKREHMGLRGGGLI